MKTHLLRIDICYSKTIKIHPNNCYSKALTEIKFILNKYNFREISESIYLSEICNSAVMEVISATLAIREICDDHAWFKQCINQIYLQDIKTLKKTDAICIIDDSFLMAALENCFIESIVNRIKGS